MPKKAKHNKGGGSSSFYGDKNAQQLSRKEQRAAKQKCNLCKQMGHTRKECPGIEDNGR